VLLERRSEPLCQYLEVATMLRRHDVLYDLQQPLAMIAVQWEEGREAVEYDNCISHAHVLGAKACGKRFKERRVPLQHACLERCKRQGLLVSARVHATYAVPCQ
jgi:hypothetical protein